MRSRAGSTDIEVASYYARFHASAMRAVWQHINDYLVRWLMRSTNRWHATRQRPGRNWVALDMRTAMHLCIGLLDVSRRLDDGSRMSREAHVRFCEGMGVQLPRPTHPKLKGPAKWTCFHLCMILDIFSRHVVGWLIAERESADLAEQLIDETVARHVVERGMLTLHAGRDASMRFFAWYNTRHHHSGIGYMTPHSVQYGHAQALRVARAATLDAAFLARPDRFKGRRPQPHPLPMENFTPETPQPCTVNS